VHAPRESIIVLHNEAFQRMKEKEAVS